MVMFFRKDSKIESAAAKPWSKEKLSVRLGVYGVHSENDLHLHTVLLE